MEKDDNKHGVYKLGPDYMLYAKTMVQEKQRGLKEGRKIPTFIADDRRTLLRIDGRNPIQNSLFLTSRRHPPIFNR